MKLVLLTTCDNTINANLIKSKLESEGVLCFLNNENFTNLAPQYYNMLGSGVRVMVPEDQIIRAKQIIQIHDVRVACPNCESTDIVNKNMGSLRKLIMVFIGVLIFTPIGNLLNSYVCKKCHEEFKA